MILKDKYLYDMQPIFLTFYEINKEGKKSKLFDDTY